MSIDANVFTDEMSIFKPMRYILIYVSYSIVFVSSQMCKFNETLHSAWNLCECIAAGNEASLHIICHKRTSATIPPMPQADSNQLVVALSMTDGTLSFIQQDAFKGHEIQTLDLSNNHIQTINVNAFRGIEMKLTSLNLKSNNLSVIPSWAFTYLHQLQFLHLENNRILTIRSNTFDETQLNSLQFLHLDNNQIQLVPKLALHRMRLIVLTLANNRIDSIEKMALPQSLSVLDLRNNFLTQIPYLALKDLTELQTLNFEGNLISMMEYDPEVIFKTEILLTLRNNKITHLGENSFRSFRKLRELDLSYNQISTVHQRTFETVSHLKILDLSYNSIAFMHIGTLKNFAKTLEKLNLEENVLHTLPDVLRDLQGLTHLNLNGNKLNGLNEDVVQGFRSTLMELLLAYNQLTEIPSKILNGMHKLQHLDLSKNRISNVDRLAFGTFDGAGTSLVFLNLAGNHIRNISDPGTFLYMSTLAYLDLSYNFIESIGRNAFEKLPELEKLFLQNNHIKHFPQEPLARTAKIRHLVLDGNQIASLPSKVLENLPRMEHLSLAKNKITHIDNSIFEASSAKELKTLNLDYNRIEFLKSDAFIGLQNLQQLHIAHNSLKSLSAGTFSNLKNLRLLDISHNALTRISSHGITNIPYIETILLNNNNIEFLDRNIIHMIRKVEAINLSKNKLKSFDCDALGEITELHTLDLSYNHLTRIELSCIKRSLRRLNVGYNKLQTIRKEMMENFEQLQEISLKNNGIMEIQSHSLRSCPKLTYIDISHNYIKTIWRDTFSHQEMVEYLDLSHNALNQMPHGSLGNNNLHNLDLSHNQFGRIPIEALEPCSESLGSLIIDSNKLKLIDSPQLVGLKNVSRLSLSNNLIESVEEAAFEHLSNLRSLDMSHNPISSWSPTAFRDISHAIISINLASTGLFSIPKFSHRALRHLNISKNKIYELSQRDVSPISKLVSLDISYNTLEALEPTCLEELLELKFLNISGNPMIRLNDRLFAQLSQLESLYMANMPQLKELPTPQMFGMLATLKELRINNYAKISNYNITEILRLLPPLRSLHVEIKDNFLKEQLHSADKRIMRELHIVGRNIKEIDVGAFHGLRGYRFNLQLSNSSVKKFPQQIFNTLTSVSFLSLSLNNNKITTFEPFKDSTKIPVVNQHGTILHSIDLRGNSLECNCRFWWLMKWLSIWPDERNKWENLHCDNNIPLLQIYESRQPYCNLSYNSTGIIIAVYFIFLYSLVV